MVPSALPVSGGAHLAETKTISIMIKSQIGTNAGKIWQFLDQHGEKTIPEIQEELAMKSLDVRMALGWLARENKIFFYEDAALEQIILLY